MVGNPYLLLRAGCLAHLKVVRAEWDALMARWRDKLRVSR